MASTAWGRRDDSCNSPPHAATHGGERRRGHDRPQRMPAEQPQTAASRTGRCPRRAETVPLLDAHPKTGTAFGATLAAVGCPEQPKQRNVRKWSDACSRAGRRLAHAQPVYQGEARRRNGGHAHPVAAGAARELRGFFGLREWATRCCPLGHPEKNRRPGTKPRGGA